MYDPTDLCPVCGRGSDGPFRPCGRCRRIIEYRPGDRCPRCGIDLAGGNGLCTSCRERSAERILLALDAAGDWRGPLREWLSVYKYGGDVRMGDYLAELLLTLLRAKWPGLPVVPVPPRLERLRKKGFDPVNGLACHLERRGVEINRALIRVGSRTQKSLGRSERLASGALDYRIGRKSMSIDGNCVLLDDVYTTGATLEACASALCDAGAQRVYGLVVCRD